MKVNKFVIVVLGMFLLCGGSLFSQNIPIGTPLNGMGTDEFNPCISGNGKALVFEQQFPGEKAAAMISYQKNGAWSKPEELKGANTPIPTILNGGYYLNQNANSLVYHSPISNGIGGSDIYIMEKTILGTWGATRNPGKPLNSPAHETDPSLSPDGKFLYFTRLINTKTPNGAPCGKIFVSERLGKDLWKAPVMLPSPINMNCECGGRMLSDNKTFLFASMREEGMGGYDIYKTILLPDGTWENPVPYKFINTDKDERYVSVPAAGGLIYYTGAEKGGGLDVFRSKIPDELQPDKVTLLQGTVRNAATNLTLVPKVVVTNVVTNKSVIYPGAADGSYTAFVPQDNVYDVAIMSQEGGTTFKSYLFKTAAQPKYEEKTIDVKLNPIKPDVLCGLNNLSFVNNSDTLESFSNVEVMRLFILLKANITSRIEIGVHTNSVISDTIFQPGMTGRIIDTLGTYADSTGRELYRLRTTYTTDNTLNQAKAIVRNLVKRGIPVERVIPKGYGDRQPLSPAPADAILNRRVELKIIHE